MHRCTGETRTVNREPRTANREPRTARYSHRLWGVLSWDRLNTEPKHRPPTTDHRPSNIEKGLPASSTSSTHRPQNTSGFHNGRSNTGKGKGTHSDMGRKTQIHETRNMAPAASGANAPHPRPFASAPCVPHLKTQYSGPHSAQCTAAQPSSHTPRPETARARVPLPVPRVLLPPCPLSLAPFSCAPSRPVPGTGARYESVHVDPQRPGNGERGTGNGERGTGNGARGPDRRCAGAFILQCQSQCSLHPARPRPRSEFESGSGLRCVLCALYSVLSLLRCPSRSPYPSSSCSLPSRASAL